MVVFCILCARRAIFDKANQDEEFTTVVRNRVSYYSALARSRASAAPAAGEFHLQRRTMLTRVSAGSCRSGYRWLDILPKAPVVS